MGCLKVAGYSAIITGFIFIQTILSVFIKMKETQSHSGKDESDSTDNDSNPIEEDEIILKPKLLY